MIRRLLLAAIATGPLLALAGCHHCCSSGPSRPPQPYLPPPPGGPFIGSPGGPSPNTIPPTTLPTTPGGMPPAGGGLPPPSLDVPRNFGPSPAPNNGRPPQELLLPDQLPGGPSSRSGYPDPNAGPAFLGPPTNPPRAPVVTPNPTVQPVPNPMPKAPPAATAGLPGFTRITDGVATGRKPGLDGFDSLRQGGFRTLAYLHPAGADTSAVRDLAEKRGFAFVAIETTPENLPGAFRRVEQLATDRAARPVYVCDDDGLRTGAVWYLHFRTTEGQNADAARIRARSIGLTDQTDEGKAFWVAIQQFLANR
jgi:hypothetical protein